MSPSRSKPVVSTSVASHGTDIQLAINGACAHPEPASLGTYSIASVASAAQTMNPTFVSRLVVSLAVLSSISVTFAVPQGARPADHDVSPSFPKDEDLPPGAKDGCWPLVYTATKTLKSGATTTVLATATACV